MKGYLTEFGEWTSATTELDIPEKHILAAAIKGEPGELFYFTIEEGEPEDK